MIYIIDSAAVLNDELFYFDSKKKYLTTYRVTLEFLDFRSKSLVDNAIKNSVLMVAEPSEQVVEKIAAICDSIGARLSDADISLLALAFELKEKNEKITVITDDFGVQNILLKLKIPFQSVIRGKIKKFKDFSQLKP